MDNKTLDVVALGTCYVDINVEGSPFGDTGIPAEVELVNGAYETTPGGSAVNFCRMLGQLGIKTAFIGTAGTDAHGDILDNLLAQQHIQPTLIRRSDLQTNISFNMTNSMGRHIMLVAGTANAALSPDDALPKLKQVLPNTAALYLGGCFKLKSFQHAFLEIADGATRHNTKLVVDHGRIPEGTSPEMLEAVRGLVLRAAYYFPSREEFCTLWDVSDIEEGLRNLKDQAPGLIAVVKDGPNGAFYWADNTLQHVAAETVSKIVNLTGAGDSFNAGVIAALTKGQELHDAVAYGCRVSAAKIQNQPLPVLS